MSWGRADNNGRSFVLHPERPRLLLIGADAGIAPTIALAEDLRGALASAGSAGSTGSEGATGSEGSCASTRWKPLVLLGSDQPFPFRARPSSIIVAGIPTGVIACMPLLEEWGIPCRLASHADLPGCFDGPVTALADAWLGSLGTAEVNEAEIFANGPPAMLSSTRELAARYGIPCQA